MYVPNNLMMTENQNTIRRG